MFGVLSAMLITGKLTTVTVLTALCVQVAASPIIEYVVVTVGFTVTLTPVVAVIAVFGIQV